MNARGQQRLRKEKRRKHLAKSFKDAEVERNTILDILRKNKSVEEELALTQESNLWPRRNVLWVTLFMICNRSQLMNAFSGIPMSGDSFFSP